MRAYALDEDGNNFQAYLVHPEDLALLNELYGQPHGGRWRPIQLTADREGKRRVPRGDFPCIFTGNMSALSQRAVDALRDLLEPTGEILAVRCDDEALWLYNCTRFVDVLDEDASDLKRFKDGGIMRVRRHAWRADVDKETLFRLPQLDRSPVYITDFVVERIRSAGLVGYVLHE